MGAHCYHHRVTQTPDNLTGAKGCTRAPRDMMMWSVVLVLCLLSLLILDIVFKLIDPPMTTASQQTAKPEPRPDRNASSTFTVAQDKV